MPDNPKSLAEILALLGQPVTYVDCYTPEDREEERQSQAMPIPPAAVPLIAELVAMPENDPHRGTEHEGAFLDSKTRPRTIDIGRRLFEIGGRKLMLRAYHEVKLKGGFSYSSLERAWDGIGGWRA